MHYRTCFLSALFLLGLSCGKESFLEEPLYLKLHLNDTVFVKEYNPINGDMGHGYGFGTPQHLGNGYGASFTIDDMRYIQFTFGQLTSQYPQVTYDRFKSLFVEGAKKYDSITLAYNQVNTDRVEVDYRDEHGKRWSSTHLVFDNTSRQHSVNQPGSLFVIQEVKELTINGKQAIKLKGYFHCTLYETNGSRTKQLKVEKFVTQVVWH